MCRNRFRLARPLEHKQLRENSDRLEIYGKSPHYLRQGEAVIEHKRKEKTGSEQVLDLECVNGWVVRGSVEWVCRQRVPEGNTCATHRKRNFMR